MLVLSILTALVTIIGSLFNQDYWGYFPAKWWARIWCWLHLVRIRVAGREHVDHETSYVFVANHQGAYDIFSIYGFLGHNFKWMMRKGITNIPLIGTACRMAGHILVDTHSTQGLRDTMAAAKKKLHGGMSIVVFPEGPGTITLTFHKPIEHTGGNDIAQVSHECRTLIQQDLPQDMRD